MIETLWQTLYRTWLIESTSKCTTWIQLLFVNQVGAAQSPAPGTRVALPEQSAQAHTQNSTFASLLAR